MNEVAYGRLFIAVFYGRNIELPVKCPRKAVMGFKSSLKRYVHYLFIRFYKLLGGVCKPERPYVLKRGFARKRLE